MFAHRRRFLFWPLAFSRALGCGARRVAACTLGASLGPGRGPWRVLCAFKVTRELASNHGIAFRLTEPRRTTETPNCKVFAPLLLLYALSCLHYTASLMLSISLLCVSHGTTIVAQQAPPVVTGTDGADGASVCSCVPCFLSNSETGMDV